MKVGAILAVLVLAAAAAAGTYWVSKADTAAPAEAVGAKADASAVEEPTPAEKGPHPKVVLSEDTYKFDFMKVGDSRTHTFVVKNEGEAPLRLGKPTTTCQCTVPSVKDHVVPPGGETTVTVEWKPEVETDAFEKGATIRTNDPAKPEIKLTAVGVVDRLVWIEPGGTWNVGEVSGEIPNDLSGYVYSRLLDKFAIESVETSNPLLTVEAEPADPTKLAAFKAKSGYRLRATLAPGMPVGRFTEKVAVKTDVEGVKPENLKFEFVGTRRGPVNILPTPGVRWNPDTWAIDLERFPAAAGKSASVTMFVSGLPDGQELKFESVKSAEPYVTVDLKRVESTGSEARQRYLLTFSVSPGSPPATHRNKGSVEVEAVTNHPEASTMKFSVHFISMP